MRRTARSPEGLTPGHAYPFAPPPATTPPHPQPTATATTCMGSHHEIRVKLGLEKDEVEEEWDPDA